AGRGLASDVHLHSQAPLVAAAYNRRVPAADFPVDELSGSLEVVVASPCDFAPSCSCRSYRYRGPMARRFVTLGPQRRQRLNIGDRAKIVLQASNCVFYFGEVIE